jgi:hypothetical protein
MLCAGVLLMIRLTVALALAVGSGGLSFAQDPYAVAPQAYKKQFENDFVRVTRVHYAPHEQLTEHGHPRRPTIYIYLKDGGPVLFKHEHGDSGAMAAIRPATKAGAYRIALGRNETHVVDNQSDLPSDFLQVELKTEIDPQTFNGRRFRDPANATSSSNQVEFETPQLRIVRVTCTEAAACASASALQNNPALLVATGTGDTTWLPPDSAAGLRAAGEYLLVEFKQGDRERP